MQHPVPPGLNWGYVLGSATLVAFIVQVVTGVGLAFTYVPAPNSAYETLQFISHQAILGNVVRGIHYFGASAMVIFIVFHLIQVFLTGGFKYPREVNWLTGTLLLLLTLGMAWSGQLLRWDQNAYWSIVVGAEYAGRVPLIGEQISAILLAGHTVGGATLTRFYATHVFLFPALIIATVGLHLYLVVRHGISEPPRPGERVSKANYFARYHEMLRTRGEPFWPDAAWKDVVAAVAIGAVVLLLAVVVGAPELAAPADPTNVQAYPLPDWYFVWLFAVLALLPPALENAFMIGFPVLMIVALLALPFVANGGERHWSRRPWAVFAVGISLLAIALLIREGYQAPWSPVMNPGALPASATQGLTGSAAAGAQVFTEKACHSCHVIDGSGGHRGPDLSDVALRLSRDQMIARILNGATNMPAFAGNIDPTELEQLVDFLATRRARPGFFTAPSGE